ncbi:hypothetical protein [Dehalococcoides mccartyi]|uniref:hypothetical protein n=1 Tax=Dehalococcoides mccartyi TaxID=61435 RepID=UPI0006BD8C5F|nr:hypothetical protein [Dehalococcoides mccartyi]BAS31233.1 hypothetical protein IBK_0158 [Dehalococcoides mccartyi IBARAKI]
MQYFDEAIIRKKSDQPTGKMFDMWHQECLLHIKNDMDVIMADRRQNPQLRDEPGEINSASPFEIGNKLYLVLWFDSVDPIKPLLVSHELGHYVLALRGNKFLVDPGRTYGEIVINLNSLVQHPPLFALQRSIGHEPQEMIDLKAQNDYDYLNQNKERKTQFWIPDALNIADDLINCSEKYRLRLNNTLKKRFPNTNHLIRSIMDSLNIDDLFFPDKNLKSLHKLAKVLKLERWTEDEQISRIVAHFNKQK